MRACDIKQGEVYRLKSSLDYGYIKVLCFLKPRQILYYNDFNGVFRADTNKNGVIIVRALYSPDKDFTFGFVRDFIPREILCKSIDILV